MAETYGHSVVSPLRLPSEQSRGRVAVTRGIERATSVHPNVRSLFRLTQAVELTAFGVTIHVAPVSATFESA